MTRDNKKSNSKGGSQPGGHDRQSDKKDQSKLSEKRKHSGNNHSGFTPDDKKQSKPVQQVIQVKPAEPSPVSDTSKGDASTSEITVATSVEATKKLEDLSLVSGKQVDDQNEIFTEQETNELLDSDEDMDDLDEKEEEKIAKEELGIQEKGGDPAKQKTYASAASGKDDIRGFEVLYVHSGVKDRSPITEDEFFKLWDRIDFKTMDKMLEDENVPGDGVLWKKWAQGRGLICVNDKESSDFVKELVSETKVKGKSFKCWSRGEFGESRLVTGYLRGNAHKGRSGDQLMKLLVKQNKLAGKHSGVVMKDKDDGRELRFCADSMMWKDLVSRLPKSTKSSERQKLRLKLGLGFAKFKLWKEKPIPKAGQGDSNQQNPPVASTSSGDAGETDPEQPKEEEKDESQEPMLVDPEAKKQV